MLEIVGNYSALAGAVDPDIARLLAVSGGVLEGSMAEEAISRNLGRNAVVVKETTPSRARRYPLGFDSGAAVASGAQTIINSQPQVIYRAERFVVPSDIAGSFVIDDLQVGKNSQFANDVPVPARIFDEQATAVELRGDTAQTSQNIVVKATNTSGAPVRFRAAILGTALEY